jgi:O-antigen ligase
VFDVKQIKLTFVVKHIKMAYLREKINKIGLPLLLLLVVVFLLPIQTRMVRFLTESHVNQSYVFYNTLFLHLTDLVLVAALCLLLFWHQFPVKQGNKHVSLAILAFLAISFISTIVSHETNEIIVFFGLFKLIIGITLFCFTLNTLSNISVKQLLNIIFWLILAISIFQLLLGVSQYFSQHSFGIKILGEEYLRPYLDGVAKFRTADGSLWIFDRLFGVSRETYIMRPYGTLPHPNVFGAFMGFTSIFTYYLFLVSRGTKKRGFLGLVIFAQIFGLIISFSRVAICAWVLASAVWLAIMFAVKTGWLERKFHMKLATDGWLDWHKQDLKKLLGLVVFSLGFCALIFYPQFLERGGIVSYGTTNAESVSDRLLYQKVAVEMIKKQPLLGVGYQNFVLAMDEYSPMPIKPYQHQPVHNIYLLVASETGILGLAAFLLFLFFVLRSALKSFTPLKIAALAVFAGFLFIGFFDHYLLTIQQGRLMFFLAAGILAADPIEHIENKKAL